MEVLKIIYIVALISMVFFILVAEEFSTNPRTIGDYSGNIFIIISCLLTLPIILPIVLLNTILDIKIKR